LFKTQLSSSLIPEKILIVLVWIITFFSFSAVALYLPLLPIIIIILLLVLYSVYVVYMASLNVSYDAAFVFVTDRKTEKIIKLENIKEIKKSFHPASPRTRWKIVYIDYDLVEEELNFYPKDDDAMFEFIKTARQIKPTIDCD